MAAFNEMLPDGAGIRQPYAAYEGWLSAQDPKRLADKMCDAERVFRRTGITFNVYGEEEAAERLIPFDIVPRILSGSEWRRLTQGIEQRVQALNAFLDDIYHRQEILKAGRVPRGLIAGTEGNVSARLGPDVILATTAGTCKGDIDESHVVALSRDGRPLDPNRTPSTEIRMHLALYKQRPDVAAIVHAHPPTATGFAVAGEDFMAPVLPELMFLVGPVPLVPYGQPGTDEVAERLAPYAREHDAFLLANHGATTVGKSLVMKRFRARARGRVGRIEKPISRLRIVVEEREEAA